MPNETNQTSAGRVAAKTAPSPSTCSSPFTAASDASAELQLLHAALGAIAQFAAAVAARGGTAAAVAAPKLLTSAEFAERFGDVTPETVEDWCRKGRFPHAQCWGRAGWRIPEFYLYRKTPPLDQARYFEDGVTAGASVADGATDAPPQTTGAAAGSAGSPTVAAEDKPKLTSDGFDPNDILAYRERRRQAATPEPVSPEK